MPATLRGVYHNLRESKYTISNEEVVFFFSSEVYLNKFMDRYEENRKEFIERWGKIVSENPLNVDTLADVLFYKEVEKRGFYVWLHGVEITWEDLNYYVLRKMLQKETPVWKRIERPTLSKRFG